MGIIRRILWLLLLLLPLLPWSAWANDTTYYVDRLRPGSDSNNGTSQTTPFLTIAHCVAVATSPGDRCQAKNGTYPEYVQMGASGTAGHPITLENFPGHSPKIQPTSHNLQGIQLQASGAYPGTNGIQYVTIQGLEITSAGYDGIKINSGSHIVMRNNNIHDNGGWDPTAVINGNGILSVGCYQCTIDKNRIYHNGCMACPKAHGLYLYGSGWTITNNLIYDNARYGIQTSSHAFDAANMASAVPGLAGWANGLIANNTIAYNRDRAGIVIWNAGSGIGLMTGIQVVNNILIENGATSSDGSTAQGIDLLSVSGLTLTVNNNIAYGSGTGSTVFTSGSTGVTLTSLSTNCPATVGGNCGTRPAMTNAPATVPASPDFHLSAGSSALSFGANLTSFFTTDFSGTTRPATGTWSAGAYAASIPADTTPPTAPSSLAATFASTSQINLTWNGSTDNVGVTDYLVERCAGVGCVGFAQITTTTTTSLIDTGLTVSMSYSYRVRATDLATNRSAYSNTATAVTGVNDFTPPTAPTGVYRITATQTSITIGWLDSTDNVAVAGYQVSRCTGSGCTPNQIVTVGTPALTTFANPNQTCGTTYNYIVVAVDTSNNLSAPSSPFQTSTLGCLLPPNAPTSVTLSATSEFARNTITWAWTQGTGTAADGFHVQCGTVTLARTTTTTVPVNAAQTIFMKDVLPGQGTWFCTVTAYNAGGDSAEVTEASSIVLGPGFGAWGFAY